MSDNDINVTNQNVVTDGVGQSQMAEKKKDKIQWLSVLQGFSMLLVIIVHVRLCNGQISPLSAEVNRIIETFCMPLFMFVSGWLFYYSCIRKEKPYKEVIKSKFIRLGVPFYAFSIAATLVKYPLPFLMRRPVDAEELLKTFVLYCSNPLQELWFVTTLFELMLLYPFYRFVVKDKKTALLGLAVALVVFFVLPRDIYYFRVCYIRFMLIFFMTGILASRFSILEKINGWMPVIIGAVVFGFFYYFKFVQHAYDLLMTFSGIFLSVALCRKIASYRPSMFSSFRDYTYQIFLMGIFFQMPFRWLFKSLGQEWLYIPFYIMSLLAGLYMPTLIAKYVERKAPRFVRMCFGLT